MNISTTLFIFMQKVYKFILSIDIILMTIRKTPQQIKKEILDFLFEGPKSNNEIATKINSNWPTTSKYLEELKAERKVNEIISSDKMKVYRRIDDPIYYSLPFNKEIRIKTLYLLKEVEERWKKEKGIELSKTALQKIAVDIIKTQNLNLPILNFHYGMTTCASFDSNNKEILELVTEPKEKEKILEGIKEALKDKRHDGIAYRERLYQYNKYKMDFYLAKENLTKLFILYEKDNSKKTFKNELRQAILELSLNYPIKLDKFYFDFERFIRNTQIILSNKKSDEVDNLEIIKGTLIQLWDKLTAFTSFKDAEEFIDNDKKQLFEQIRELNYNFKEMNYKIYIEELESLAQGINPFEINLPVGDSSKEIQRLIIEGLESE